MKNFVYTKTFDSIEINKKEILRYAGVGESTPEISRFLDECITESACSIKNSICYSRYKISIDGENLDLGFAKVKSHSLALCLKDCEEIMLFCATIGHAFDRLIERYSITQPSRGVVFQALGSERVESLCDKFCYDLSIEEAEEGRALRPRFSPGYGDLPLELQREIFSALDCGKRIGVSLGENLFMSPSKSVTAIVGIKKDRKNENS